MKKIGVDLHGVITHEPHKYKTFMSNIMKLKGEAYVLTGSTYEDARSELGKMLFIQGRDFTNIISVTDYLLDQGLSWVYDKHNRPWFEEDIWDKAKAELAEELELDVHFDDILRYKKHFKKTEFIYCPRIENSV